MPVLEGEYKWLLIPDKNIPTKDAAEKEIDRIIQYSNTENSDDGMNAANITRRKTKASLKDITSSNAIPTFDVHQISTPPRSAIPLSETPKVNVIKDAFLGVHPTSNNSSRSASPASIHSSILLTTPKNAFPDNMFENQSPTNILLTPSRSTLGLTPMRNLLNVSSFDESASCTMNSGIAPTATGQSGLNNNPLYLQPNGV